MRVLFLSQRVPYPPDRGDKITTYHLLMHLAARHEVVVGCFVEEERELTYVAELERRGIRVHFERIDPKWRKILALRYLLTRQPLTLPYFRSAKLARAVRAEVEAGAAFLLAYSSSMGQYLLPYRDLPKIQVFAELDSDKWRQYARSSGFPGRFVYAREARRLLTFERVLARAVDWATVVSEVEKELFERSIPGTNVAVLPNGVDLERFRPGPWKAREPHTVLFTGVMDYGANVDGVRWFAAEVWPRIREVLPEARFVVCGSRPVPAIRALDGRDGIEVTGWVESTLPSFDRARVAVAPLRIARGIQNKVLEAMACGLPVVSTTSAFSGIQAHPGEEICVEDAAPRFAAAVLALLRDEGRAEEMGRAARRRVEATYRWEAILGTLDDLIERSIDARRPGRAAAPAR